MRSRNAPTRPQSKHDRLANLEACHANIQEIKKGWVECDRRSCRVRIAFGFGFRDVYYK